MKRLFLFFSLLLTVNVFAQNSSGNLIELPELVTTIDGKNISIPVQAVPDFKPVADPNPVVEAKDESLLAKRPPELPLETKPKLVPIEEPKVSKLEGIFIRGGCNASFIGTFSSFLNFENTKSFIPFSITLKQNSLFSGNSRTDLFPNLKMSYKLKNFDFGLSGGYLAQCLDFEGTTFNRGNVNLNIGYQFKSLKTALSGGVVFSSDGVIVPFDVKIGFQTQKIETTLSGGLRTSAADVVELVKYNPDCTFNDETAEESDWFVQVASTIKLKETLNLKGIVLFAISALGNGILSPDYTSAESDEIAIVIKERNRLNTELGIVFSPSIWNIELIWKAFWLDYDYMAIPHDVFLKADCKLAEKWNLNFAVENIIQMCVGKNGGLSVSVCWGK